MDNETENVVGIIGEGDMPKKISLDSENTPEANQAIPKVYGEYVYIIWKGKSDGSAKPLDYLSTNGLHISLGRKSLMRVPVLDLTVLKPLLVRDEITIVTDADAEVMIRDTRISREDKLKLYHSMQEKDLDEIKDKIPEEVLEKLKKAGLKEEIDDGMIDKFVKFMSKKKSKGKSKKGKAKSTLN